MNGINNRWKGFGTIAVDSDFLELINNFKKSLEKELNRPISYPFATSLLKNVFPKDIKLKKVLIKDKSRRNRTIQFTVEYLSEEI
jgi:hypothetical protein